MQTRTGRSVSATTIRKALYQLGHVYEAPQRKRLTQAQKLKRVEFARAHLHDAWDNTWSLDECYFQLWRSSNRCWVKRGSEELTDSRRLTRSQTKVSAAVLCIISRRQKVALASLKRGWQSQDFVNSFSLEALPAYTAARRTSEAPLLLMDNDGRHETSVFKDFLRRNRIRVVKNWPSNSPDLNPIENVFSWMKRFVEKKEPSTEAELRAAVAAAWSAYPSKFLKNLFDSMPTRMKKVIERGGNRIQY